jgi:hypothetical protein
MGEDRKSLARGQNDENDPQETCAQRQISPEFLKSFWEPLFPGQIPSQLVAPDVLESDKFYLEGKELQVVSLGHTDTSSTTGLYVSSIGLVTSGDCVYNDTHLYLCRPLTSGAACTGGRRPKASKGGNRGKGYEGRAAGSMGICLWRVNLRSEFQRRPASGATTTLTFWHECCEWVKALFLISCNFKQLRVAKRAHISTFALDG